MHKQLSIFFWIFVCFAIIRFFFLLKNRRKGESIFIGSVSLLFVILYFILTYEHTQMIMMVSGCVMIGSYFIFCLAYHAWKCGINFAKNLLIVGFLILMLFVFVVCSPPKLDIVTYPSLEEAKVKIGSKFLIPDYIPQYVDPYEHNLSYEHYYAQPTVWNDFAFLPPDNGVNNVDTFMMDLTYNYGNLPKATDIYDYAYYVGPRLNGITQSSPPKSFELYRAFKTTLLEDKECFITILRCENDNFFIHTILQR